MTALVLIVDDEQDLVKTLEYSLQKEGFRTRVAFTGQSAMDSILAEPHPDLILLDLMLPDLSGIEVCRKVRQNDAVRTIPILMLTAKGEEIDRVVGFEVGADDYMVKPFSVRELILRIKAILRRGQARMETNELISFGILKLDEPGHRLWVEDKEVRLTALEFKLLVTLLARKGRVQSRDTLLSDVWGFEAEITTRTVDTHVKRLREKLAKAGDYIETLRGVGYRFRSQPETPDE